MSVKTLKGISLFRFGNLSSFADIDHFVSHKKENVNEKTPSFFNMSYAVGRPENEVNNNRQKLYNALDIKPDNLIFPSQTHSSEVKIVDSGIIDNLPGSLAKTDAIITNQKDWYIAVLVADCVPVLIYEPQRKVVAAIHSGWRGTVNAISSKTVALMTKAFSCKPENMFVGIGPSISAEKYQVRDDVINEVCRNFSYHNELLTYDKQNKCAYFDMWQAIRKQLCETGIKDCNIETAEICTFSNSDLFFSARNPNGSQGRFAAGISLK